MGVDIQKVGLNWAKKSGSIFRLGLNFIMINPTQLTDGLESLSSLEVTSPVGQHMINMHPTRVIVEGEI